MSEGVAHDISTACIICASFAENDRKIGIVLLIEEETIELLFRIFGVNGLFIGFISEVKSGEQTELMDVLAIKESFSEFSGDVTFFLNIGDNSVEELWPQLNLSLDLWVNEKKVGLLSVWRIKQLICQMFVR